MNNFNKQEVIEQISIFDIDVTEKPKNIAKSTEKFTEIKVKSTNINELSQEQQRIIDIYKCNINLNRIIKYCYGGIGIELIKGNSYRTIYVNTKGIEEFVSSKKSSVLPLDTILYYKTSNVKPTDIQDKKLKDLMNHIDFKRVIKRNGDDNILVEANNKIIDILQNGWVLEFESVISVDCSEDEVYKLPRQKEIVNIGESVRVGDVVKAYYGKTIIEGLIVREYGLGNAILNIDFELEGRKCQTAIGRHAVIEILEEAM